MRDQQAALILQSVGALAMMWDAELTRYDPQFDLATEIDLCLNYVPDLPADVRRRLREMIQLVVENPTEFRKGFCDELYALNLATGH